MKVGIRTPSVEKRVKARTTGKIKRKVKKAAIPLYGHKGLGYVKDPERAIKNKIYRKVTIDPITGIKHVIKHTEDGEIISDKPRRVDACTIFGALSIFGSVSFLLGLIILDKPYLILLALGIVFCIVYLIADRRSQ